MLWSGVAITSYVVVTTAPVGQYQEGWPHLTPVSRGPGQTFYHHNPSTASLFVEITKKNLVPLSSGKVFLIFCVLKLFFNWIKGLEYLHALPGLVTVTIGLAASWGTHGWNREENYYKCSEIMTVIGNRDYRALSRERHRMRGVMGFSSGARKRFKTQIKRFLDETQWFSDYLGLPLTFTFLHKVSLLLFHLRYSATGRRYSMRAI